MRGGSSTVVSVAAAALLALTYWASREQCAELRERERARALHWTTLMASRQQNLLDEAAVALELLSRLPELRRPDLRDAESLLGGLLERRPQYAALGLGRDDGEVLISLAREGSARSWLRERILREEAGALVTGLPRDPGGLRLPGVLLTHRVHDRTHATMLFAVVQLGAFGPEPSYGLPPGASLTLWDRTGVVLARFPDPGRWRGLVAPSLSVFHAISESKIGSPGTEGVIEGEGLDGVRRLYAFASIGPEREPGSALLVFGLPSRRACESVRRLGWISALGIACMTALALACRTRERSTPDSAERDS